VYGDDRLRIGGQFINYIIRVKVERIVDIGHDGDCACLQDRLVGGDEGESRDDYFIARADIQGRQGDLQGRRAGGYPQGISGPAIGGNFLFKLADLEDPLPFRIESVAHQDACFHDVHNFLSFFLAENLKTGHFP